MTQVLILLAALNGHHNTTTKCDEITESLCSLLSFNLVYGKEYHEKTSNVDRDLKAIGKFRDQCIKRNAKND